MPSLPCSSPRYYRLVAVAVVPTGADAVACSVSPIRSVIMMKFLRSSPILTPIVLVVNTTVAAIAMDKRFAFVSKCKLEQLTDAIDVEAEIQELKDQLQAVREELMDDRVEISTIVFVSEVQSHSWMYANCVPINTFYRFYDAVSLLTILTHSGASINEEMMLDKNAKSGSFLNKEAATFAASFALELPEFFGKETTSNQHRDDRELPAIPSHNEWDAGLRNRPLWSKEYDCESVDEER
eukprot:scaffold20529_cov53-Attheya_sp.AAC.3